MTPAQKKRSYALQEVAQIAHGLTRPVRGTILISVDADRAYVSVVNMAPRDVGPVMAGAGANVDLGETIDRRKKPTNKGE